MKKQLLLGLALFLSAPLSINAAAPSTLTPSQMLFLIFDVGYGRKTTDGAEYLKKHYSEGFISSGNNAVDLLAQSMLSRAKILPAKEEEDKNYSELKGELIEKIVSDVDYSIKGKLGGEDITIGAVRSVFGNIEKENCPGALGLSLALRRSLDAVSTEKMLNCLQEGIKGLFAHMPTPGIVKRKSEVCAKYLSYLFAEALYPSKEAHPYTAFIKMTEKKLQEKMKDPNCDIMAHFAYELKGTYAKEELDIPAPLPLDRYIEIFKGGIKSDSSPNIVCGINDAINNLGRPNEKISKVTIEPRVINNIRELVYSGKEDQLTHTAIRFIVAFSWHKSIKPLYEEYLNNVSLSIKSLK